MTKLMWQTVKTILFHKMWWCWMKQVLGRVGRAGQGRVPGVRRPLMHTKDVFVSILYELIFLSTLQVGSQKRSSLLGLLRSLWHGPRIIFLGNSGTMTLKLLVWMLDSVGAAVDILLQSFFTNVERQKVTLSETNWQLNFFVHDLPFLRRQPDQIRVTFNVNEDV